MRYPGPYRPPLPAARGPLSEFVIDRLTAPGDTAPPLPLRPAADPLGCDDHQLALYLCYELHYRSFAGVDDDREWDPHLLVFRRELERSFLARLRDEAHPDLVASPDVRLAITEAIDAASGPSLSQHMATSGTLEEMREFAVHRSAYQLKEADPHTWAIPRLDGNAKAALVRIQADEYGHGDRRASHAELFAETMRCLDLDARYGAYLDLLPGTTLATVNLVSLFGLHRRWRGALVGHLTVFEMTSVVPMGRYASALERLGAPARARRFYEVHVTADAEHEVVALDELAAGLAAAEPSLVRDVVFGARAVLEVEQRFAERLLGAWADGSTSLCAAPAAA
jgi:hypothetical protein